MYSLLTTALFSLGVAAGPLSTSHLAGHNNAGRTLTLAPVLLPHPEVAHNAINNSYIVVLKKGAALDDHVMAAQDAHASSTDTAFQGGIRHVYDSHIKGYAGLFSQSTLEQLRAMPEVDYIEQDQLVYAVDVSPLFDCPG